MFSYIADTLRANPQLAIFLTLAVGYWVGAKKFGSFSLGAVTGTLLAGIIIGQLGIDISGQVKSIFFIMFLFAVGFGVGPQFVRGIATDGAPQAIFAVVVSVLCLLVVYIAAIVSGYGPGLAAGLLAGAQTISASIGLATDAINQSGLTPEEAKAQLDLIPVAYAITYLFGTIGTGWILAFLGPKMLGVDIAAECARYEREMSGGAPKASFISARRARELRAYTHPRERQGRRHDRRRQPKGSAATSACSSRACAAAARWCRFTPETVLKAGDVVAVSGRREVLVSMLGEGVEVDDTELLDVPVEAVDVLLTSKDAERPHPGRGVAAALHPRRLPLLDPARLGGGEHPRAAADQAQPRRHPARHRHQGQRRPLRQGGRLRRPAADHHRHGAGRLRHPDRRPDRRGGDPGRRRPDHAQHLRRRADRRHLLRLAPDA